MLTTRAPDEVVVRLIVGVHVAIVEVHIPRIRGIIGIRRRRPIVGRLDASPAHFGRRESVGQKQSLPRDSPLDLTGG